MKILVTGFEPFNNESLNPSLEVIKRLPKTIKGAQIITNEIPTEFNQSGVVIEKLLEEQEPDAVLCIGQAGGRSNLTIERIAINIDDARIPDNCGDQPVDTVIQDDGENAYFSTLPIKAMMTNIQQSGIPASISNSAGTYVCNHLMYQVLYLTRKKHPNTIAGFMHIPYMSEQVIGKTGIAFMSLEDMIIGVIAAIEAIVTYDKQADLKITGGTIH